MSRKAYAWSKQVILATALALGAPSLALADDNSMSPFTGDSYKYFNGGHNLGDRGPFNRLSFSNVPTDPSWRQSHPSGLTERELQALSSSDLSASASQLNPPVFASVATDPSWRQSHPNGLTERELQAAGSSSLAAWQGPNGSRSTDRANVAQIPSRETFAARLARSLRSESGTQAGTN